MTEATIEKAACEKCGAEIRENTSFCYNCGDKYGETAEVTNGAETAAMSEETKSALDDLAERFKIDEDENSERLKQAAAERKKARVAPKRQKEYVWEEETTRSVGGLFAISILILLIVAGIVFVTVYWK
jgi:hypothetical protein